MSLASCLYELKKFDEIHVYHHFDADGFAAASVIGALGRIKSVEELYHNYFPTIQKDCEEEYVTLNHINEMAMFMKQWKNQRYEYNIKFHVVEHSHPMDFNCIDPDTKTLIFILDYSFSRSDDQEIIKELMANDNIEIHWIDHHESSKLLTDFKDLRGVRIYNTKLSGCALTYIYINVVDYNRDEDLDMEESSYNTNMICIRRIREYLQKSEEDRYMKYIKYISDYDTWTHEDPSSIPFTKWVNILGLYDTFLNIDKYDSYTNILAMYYFNMGMNSDKEKVLPIQMVDPTNEYIENGERLVFIDDIRNKKTIRNAAFECDVKFNISRVLIDPEKKLDFGRYLNKDTQVLSGSIKLLCVNRPGNSLLFGDKFEEYDAVVVYTHNGENFVYSMYSKEDGFQCNILALYFNHKYGITGGGHYHAAGWSSPCVVFTDTKNKECVWINEVLESTD